MDKVFFNCVVMGLSCVLWSISATNVAAETRLALLIGINEYQTEKVPNLRGTVNDVETMREILIGRYGFPESNVTVLTDAAATRQGILNAFDDLVEQTSADDMVYVHYSGHGSQVKDRNGDEDDQTDETILPHDARTKGIPDITDDELGNFLSRLPAESAIIVLDSCHSGTATRGGIATRSVPADERLDLYGNTDTGFATRALVPIDVPDQYILLSGAASHQSALDGPIQGKYRGIFSYALAEALKNVEPQASPRDIHRHVEQTYQQLSQRFGGLKIPDPQFEADTALLDKPLFPATQSAEAKKAFLYFSVEGKAQGRLMRGSAMDAGVGTYWAIFSPDETDFLLGEALAKALVVRMDDADSIVEFEGPTLESDISYRAVPLSKPMVPEAVLVRLEIADADWSNELQVHLTDRVAGIQYVGPDDFARFVIVADGDRLRVFDASGFVAIDEFQISSGSTAGDKLAELLNRSRTAVSLSQMTNPASNLLIHASIVGADTDNEMHVRRSNETRSHQNSIMLQIEVNNDSYLTVIDVDPEGSINVLYPNSYTNTGFLPDGFVRANAKTRIPDSLSPDNRAGFFWDYSPPAGLDTVQVFASTDLDTANKIRNWINSLGAIITRGENHARDYSQQLIEFHNELTADVRTRAIHVVQDLGVADTETESTGATVNEQIQPDWSSVSLSIRISE